MGKKVMVSDYIEGLMKNKAKISIMTKNHFFTFLTYFEKKKMAWWQKGVS